MTEAELQTAIGELIASGQLYNAISDKEDLERSLSALDSKEVIPCFPIDYLIRKRCLPRRFCTKKQRPPSVPYRPDNIRFAVRRLVWQEEESGSRADPQAGWNGAERLDFGDVQTLQRAGAGQAAGGIAMP